MERNILMGICLDEKFGSCVIENILQKALQANFKMYAYTYEDFFNTSPLTIKEALRRIEDKEDNSSVRCFVEDTIFHLYFTKLKNGKCELGLGNISYSWKKEFWNGKKMIEFDLPRYIRLLLILVQEFKITKIGAYIGWF